MGTSESVGLPTARSAKMGEENERNFLLVGGLQREVGIPSFLGQGWRCRYWTKSSFLQTCPSSRRVSLQNSVVYSKVEGSKVVVFAPIIREGVVYANGG